MSLDTVAIIGAGTIGRGVAQLMAENGLGVVLVDRLDSQLESARADIARDLRLFTMFRRRQKTLDADEVMDRITFTTELERIAGVGLVVENVTENWEIKQRVYPAIDAICPDKVPFAVNTSAIPITRVASLTKRSDKVIGVHFMNPVPLMDTVEVIEGFHTSPETTQAMFDVLHRLGKRGVVVQDQPGFVTNRVLMLTINEAIFCIQDRVASAVDIDRIFKGCFSHKMGPLETADLIGLDTILNSITVLYESYNDCKYRPAPLLRTMVDAGLLGRKSGQGFYTYQQSGSEQGGPQWTVK